MRNTRDTRQRRVRVVGRAESRAEQRAAGGQHPVKRERREGHAALPLTVDTVVDDFSHVWCLMLPVIRCMCGVVVETQQKWGFTREREITSC